MNEQKEKRVMSPELKEKMRIGREKKLAEKNGTKDLVSTGVNFANAKIASVVSVDAKLDSVISAVNTVASALSKLIELQSAKPATEESGSVANAKVDPGFTPQIEDPSYPSSYIPPKFRKIADEILSPEFGISVTDFEDRTDFQLTIIVPEKYSSVSKEDREKGVVDIRSRIIPRALGENGVREWCTLVRRNLNKFYQQSGVKTPFNSSIE